MFKTYGCAQNLQSNWEKGPTKIVTNVRHFKRIKKILPTLKFACKIYSMKINLQLSIYILKSHLSWQKASEIQDESQINLFFNYQIINNYFIVWTSMIISLGQKHQMVLGCFLNFGPFYKHYFDLRKHPFIDILAFELSFFVLKINLDFLIDSWTFNYYWVVHFITIGIRFDKIFLKIS